MVIGNAMCILAYVCMYGMEIYFGGLEAQLGSVGAGSVGAGALGMGALQIK